MEKNATDVKNDFPSWCVTNGKESLLEEWDYDANPCTPESKSYGSHYRAAWKCTKCGHKWDAELKSRTTLNAGCPKCGFARVSIAQSRPKELCDVESICKAHNIEWLLDEWDYEENERKPNEVSRSSSKYKISWKCRKCGYKWKLTPNNRVSVLPNGQVHISECPICRKEKKTSFPEQAIYYYLKRSFPDTVNGDKETIGMEIDIYIPSLKTAVEYDGYAWHQNIERDSRKNALCKNKGINLIRVREFGCPDLAGDDFCKIFHVLPNNREDLSKIILNLFAMLGFTVDVNLNRDEPLIMALYQKNKHENSLGYLYPELTKEFHSDKNGTLHVDDINKRSSRKVWWRCSVCNHEWMAAVSTRTKGHGCPACAEKILVHGKNDLETWCKENNQAIILREWDYEKNTVRPYEITKKSPRMVSWKCSKCGSPYEMRVYNRSNGYSCPVCAGKKVRSGLNDFETWCINNGKSNILEEWSTDNVLLPSQVSHGSGKRILWVCSICGHHWSANLDNRKKGRGCPQCKRNKLSTLRQCKKIVG